jgi:hypothetical protein
LICIIIFCLLVPLIIILIKELMLRYNQLKNIRSTERDMKVIIRVLNVDGDTSFNSRIKIINSGKSPIEFIPRDIYSSPHDKMNLQVPKVVSSSINNIRFEERERLEYNKQIKIDNYEKEYKYIECDYRVSPPLRKIGDYIEYELNLDSSKYAADAFNDSCAIEGFIVKNIAKKTEMVLISPDKYKLILIDYWVEDSQAHRIEYLKSIIRSPSVINNENQIEWQLDYPVMNCLYLFKYKIIKR